MQLVRFEKNSWRENSGKREQAIQHCHSEKEVEKTVSKRRGVHKTESF